MPTGAFDLPTQSAITYTYTHALAHTHTHTTQDGVTADEVAEVNGHNVVCEELRHGDCRPLSKVSPTS